MPEAFSWLEGQLYWSTGVPFVSSAAIAYAEQTQMQPVYGWYNNQNAGGAYVDHLTGKRVNVSFGAVYTFDKTAIRMIEQMTAVHLKFIHNTINGSGGFFLYSGRFDSMQFMGQEKQVYKFNATYHANSWSGF